MPLFKRRGRDKQPGDGSPEGPAHILGLREMFDRLEEEIVRAERYGRPLAVLAIVPQQLANVPDERNATAASEFVSTQLRFCDRVGVMADGTIVAVLPETRIDGARVVAHRIASDLTLRSSAISHRNWVGGASAFPDDGADPPGMVQAAMERAQR